MRALIRRGSGIKKAQIQNSQQNEFKRVEAGSRRMRPERGFRGFTAKGCAQHERKQPGP